jgi:hypothetical protein
MVDVVEEVLGLSVVERSLETLKKYFEQRLKSIQDLQIEVSSHQLEASRHTFIDSSFG